MEQKLVTLLDKNVLEGVTAIFARHYGQLVRRELIGTDFDATPPVTEDNTPRTSSDGQRQYLHCWSALNSTRMRSCLKNSGSRRLRGDRRGAPAKNRLRSRLSMYKLYPWRRCRSCSRSRNLIA